MKKFIPCILLLALFFIANYSNAQCNVNFTSTVGGGGSATLTANPMGTINPVYYWDFGDGTTGQGNPVSHTYAASGTYIACVTMIDSLVPCSSVFCDSVVVTSGAGCASAFTTTGSGPTIQFNNAATGGSSYQWYFGDGTTSTAFSPSHTYASNGTYYACLYVFDAFGAFCDSTCQTVSVTGAGSGCTANFAYSNSGSTFFFSNTSSGANGFIWDFGDGGSSSAANPTYTYSSSGTYTVCLIALNFFGAPCDSMCQTITVGACNLSFTTSTSGNATTFTNTSSGASSYQWYFGDGSTSFANNPTHTYSSPGTYYACLYGFDALGNFCDSTCTTVTITGASGPCSSSYTYSVSGQTAFFTNASTGSYSYQWYFGDGTGSTAINPIHTYPGSGTYYACLISFDSLGNYCDSTCQNIVITGGSTGCTANFNTSVSGQTGFFTNTSSGASSYQWYFGDGSFSTSTNATHTYASSGTYNVCLYAFNSMGSFCDSTCQTITIFGTSTGCTASFSTSTSGQTAFFTNTSTGGFTFQWFFGDGSTSTAANPTHTYSFAGTYTPCLYVFDSLGSVCDSICQTVFLSGGAPCVASFNTSVSGQTGTFTNTSTGGSSYQWYYGDGTTGTTFNGSHTYASSGTYYVCLYAFDSLGSFCDSTCQSITISGGSSGCTANFVNTVSGNTSFFSNTSTGASSFQWYFGDGNTSTATNPTHTYATSGTYYACLIAFDSAGSFCDSTCSTIVIAGSGGCAVSFNTSTSGLYGYFGNTSTGASSYQWYYGDGTTSTNFNGSHTYASPGSYYVCLYGFDSFGAFCDSTCQLVTVTGGSTGCSVGFTTSISGQSGFFSNTSTGASSYQWYYGDGTTGTTVNGAHTYSSPGTYIVCLYGFDSTGLFCDSICQPITITGGSSGCTANFVHTTSGQTALFSNTSTGASSFEWYFGDGTTSTLPNPSHTYATSGSYYVCLIAFDSLGTFCDSTCTTINISGSSTCTASFSATVNGSTVTFTDASSASAGILAWNWVFGDGSTSTSMNPVHTFTLPGTYNVCLYITALDSCLSSTCVPVTITTTTGIAESNGLQSMEVWPNPTSENVNIAFTAPEAGEISIEVYNLMGQNVRTAKQNVRAGEAVRSQIDMHNLPAGNYMLRVKLNDQQFTKRVVVQ